MSDIIQGLVLIYIEAVCCSIFFDSFMIARFQNKRWLNQVIVVMLAIILTVTSHILKGGYVAKAIIVIGIMAVSMEILYKSHITQVIFFAICYYGILLAIDSGLMIVVNYLLQGRLDGIVIDTVKVTVLGVLCKSVLFLCVISIHRKFSKEEDYYLLEDNEWILFLFFPVFTVVAMLFFFVEGGNGERAVLVISFGMVASNFILFYMLKDFVGRTKESQAVRLIQERTKNQMEMYESMETVYNEQKSSVHEFKNHIGCIHGLLLDGNIEEALEYVDSISDEADRHMNHYHTSNPIINTVINQKYRQAKKEGTAIIMILDNLDGVCIHDEDLVVLLANLLDNAIEACRKLKGEERLIRFRFVQDGGKVIIAVKNPVRGKVEIIDDRVATTKGHKQEHGIGMSNIKRVVEKYGGENVCSCHDGFFYETIIIRK